MVSYFKHLAILCFAITGVLPGQTGTISGSISDDSGAAIPAASVKVSNLDTGSVRTATTDDSGTYSIPNLPVGPYEITVGKEGFQSLRLPNVDSRLHRP